MQFENFTQIYLKDWLSRFPDAEPKLFDEFSGDLIPCEVDPLTDGSFALEYEGPFSREHKTVDGESMVYVQSNLESPDQDAPTAKDEKLVLLKRIGHRASTMAAKEGFDILPAYFVCDILSCEGSCPLDLVTLLQSDDGEFAHDVFGIRRHIDRATGELADCFWPRFATQQ